VKCLSRLRMMVLVPSSSVSNTTIKTLKLHQPIVSKLADNEWLNETNTTEMQTH
jgi:hypothetical protein